MRTRTKPGLQRGVLDAAGLQGRRTVIEDIVRVQEVRRVDRVEIPGIGQGVARVQVSVDGPGHGLGLTEIEGVGTIGADILGARRCTVVPFP